MIDIKNLRVPPAPLFALGKKVAGPDEMQSIMRYARELQATINTIQAALVEAQEKIAALEAL